MKWSKEKITEPITRTDETNSTQEIFRVCLEYPFAEDCPRCSKLWKEMAQRYLEHLRMQGKTAPPGGSACMTFCMAQQDETTASLIFEITQYEGDIPVLYRRFGQIADICRDRILSPAAVGVRTRDTVFFQGRDLYTLHNTFGNPERLTVRRSAMQKSTHICKVTVHKKSKNGEKPPPVLEKKAHS